mmetsp:Transcript_149692/g.480640  ORF Transcript_149692/g.480640 Transcript_149692/m.480640 type:complete len:227 (-) Transcript_149692:125-805(-)
MIDPLGNSVFVPATMTAVGEVRRPSEEVQRRVHGPIPGPGRLDGHHEREVRRVHRARLSLEDQMDLCIEVSLAEAMKAWDMERDVGQQAIRDRGRNRVWCRTKQPRSILAPGALHHLASIEISPNERVEVELHRELVSAIWRRRPALPRLCPRALLPLPPVVRIVSLLHLLDALQKVRVLRALAAPLVFLAYGRRKMHVLETHCSIIWRGNRQGQSRRQHEDRCCS